MTITTPDHRRLPLASALEARGLQLPVSAAEVLLAEIDTLQKEVPALVFAYRNWREEEAIRHVRPIRFFYGPTEHHPEPQWILVAHDLDRDAERAFAFRDIIFVGDPLDRIWEAVDRAIQRSAEIVVEVPARDRRIAELLEANNRYQADGRRHKATAASFRAVLEAAADASSALRQGGPAPEDLHCLSEALETLISLAGVALDEADLAEKKAKEAAT